MEIEEQEGRLLRWRVRHDDAIVACVNPGSANVSFRLFRPCVHPLYTPRGVPVTEMGAHNYPHHKGAWIGHGNVNGIDFFTEHPAGSNRPIGLIVTTRTDHRGTADEARFDFDLSWQDPAGAAVVSERRELTFTRRPEAHVMDVMSSITPAAGAVEFGREPHGYFALRVLDAIDEDDGGMLSDAEGNTGEAATYGSTSGWVDCSGNVGAQAVGVTLMVHPDSPPAPFFTRAYGCIQADYFLNRSLRLDPGQRLQQRFRVIAHDGDAGTFDIEGAYRDYAAAPFGSPATA